MVIDGNRLSREILNRLRPKIIGLNQKNVTPALAVILVGDNPASISYIKRKTQAAAETGIIVNTVCLPENTPDEQVKVLIDRENRSAKTHAIIVQRPLPPGSPVRPETMSAIRPEKDVDGFVTGSRFRVPVVLAVFRILSAIMRAQTGRDPYEPAENEINSLKDYLKNRQTAIIGRGETAGGPLSLAFSELKLPFTNIHRNTPDPNKIVRGADIVISCVGKPNIVRRGWCKPGVILVSVGLSRNQNGKLVGDYDEAEIRKTASFYTPTPGGVGPVNVACLLENVVTATENSIL